MSFKLHQNFEQMSLIKSLELCDILLYPNKLFPWIILIPRIENAVEIYDLSAEAQHQLLKEIAHVSQKMKTHFKADKMNIANFGNITPQLHIHVIARFKDDECFPDTTFGPDKPQGEYGEEDKATIINGLKEIL